MLLFFHIPKSSIASTAFEVESMEKGWKINGVLEMVFIAVLPKCWGTCSHIPMTKTAEEMVDISCEALLCLL